MKPGKRPPAILPGFFGPHGVYLFIPAAVLFLQLLTAYQEMARQEEGAEPVRFVWGSHSVSNIQNGVHYGANSLIPFQPAYSLLLLNKSVKYNLSLFQRFME